MDKAELRDVIITTDGGCTRWARGRVVDGRVVVERPAELAGLVTADFDVALTARDVALRYNVTMNTIYNWIKAGRLPAVRAAARPMGAVGGRGMNWRIPKRALATFRRPIRGRPRKKRWERPARRRKT